MTVTNILIPVVGLVSAYLFFTRKPGSGLVPKPPGPEPLPLLGNIFNLPTQQLWLRVTDWSKMYGELAYLWALFYYYCPSDTLCIGKIVYAHVFGQGLVFLNTAEACADILDKRGTIYSDKPHLVMCGELCVQSDHALSLVHISWSSFRCGCENMVAFTRYGDQMRRQRRLMQRALGPTMISKYHSLLEMETPWFLKRVLENPNDYVTPIKRFAGGVTLLVMYGYQVKSDDDDFLQLAEHCVDLLANKIASGVGIWPVDIFPVCKF